MHSYIKGNTTVLLIKVDQFPLFEHLWTYQFYNIFRPSTHLELHHVPCLEIFRWNRCIWNMPQLSTLSPKLWFQGTASSAALRPIRLVQIVQGKAIKRPVWKLGFDLLSSYSTANCTSSIRFSANANKESRTAPRQSNSLYTRRVDRNHDEMIQKRDPETRD